MHSQPLSVKPEPPLLSVPRLGLPTGHLQAWDLLLSRYLAQEQANKSFNSSPDAHSREHRAPGGHLTPQKQGSEDLFSNTSANEGSHSPVSSSR